MPADEVGCLPVWQRTAFQVSMMLNALTISIAFYFGLAKTYRIVWAFFAAFDTPGTALLFSILLYQCMVLPAIFHHITIVAIDLCPAISNAMQSIIGHRIWSAAAVFVFLFLGMFQCIWSTQGVGFIAERDIRFRNVSMTRLIGYYILFWAIVINAQSMASGRAS